MKVLLYSHCFYPSVGGLETVSLMLAEAFHANSINVKVVTATAANGDKNFPYEVVRNPLKGKQINLIKWADVVLFNGANLSLQPWILLYRKPFVWIHTGYQVSCIDGLGWEGGKPAPLAAFASVIHHSRHKGWRLGLKAGAKLFARRFFAKHVVTKNVAITRWMYKAQPLPRQVHIYNPFPVDRFFSAVSVDAEYDFLYLGRMVSEKGVSTLLRAFALVRQTVKSSIRLLLIGDGDQRTEMETLSRDLQIDGAVNFVGEKSGDELLKCVAKGQIAVIPSEWNEPMGGVALELMAAGKNLIVSEKGGLKECVGEAGLSFPNGNHNALADCMVQLLNDSALREFQLEKGRKKIKEFHPSVFIENYISLLKDLVHRN